MALIEQAMVTVTNTVKARADFDFTLPPEVMDFCQHQTLRPHLPALLKGLEADGKNVPILPNTMKN
ncbi:hypothetical protein [Paraglaciecola sp.]|uniref:hypothetical protein n=1 Tax=Paraglaciecola sp. TaxID=1920173 RepID=UPI0030F380D4